MTAEAPASPKEEAQATGWHREARGLLLAAFRAAVEDAETAARTASTDQDVAVHEYRKALRRARAIAALARPAIGRDAHDTIRDELRAARREVSAARDHTVAGAALAQLALESQEREGANHLILLLQNEEPSPEEVSARLLEGAERARQQSAALEQALPSDLDVGSLTRGLARTYRQARAARKAAKRSLRAFHRWRRRTKELDAQLAVLARHAGAHTEAIRQAYSDASAVLGPIADLIMLRSLADSYHHHHPESSFVELEDALARLADEQVGAARKLARPLFATRPRKLAKALRRALVSDTEAALQTATADDDEADDGAGTEPASRSAPSAD